ncbi:MAG: hypothetical protein QNJ47_21595 [Nostocaceae cyanobacterium]|nr:hypothetical protein [Nostocaceae cyanobacterium]
MSENQQKSNFWASLPGIITAVLGSGGLVALIPVLQSLQSSPSPNQKVEPPPLEVYADTTKGIPYTNKEDKYVNIQFKAEGKWLAIPENETGVPENAKGYLSPKGAPNFNSNQTPCRVPLGALIIMGEDGKCMDAYGEQGTFELKPRETVYFLMNDVIGLYKDNEGSIKVNLSINESKN